MKAYFIDVFFGSFQFQVPLFGCLKEEWEESNSCNTSIICTNQIYKSKIQLSFWNHLSAGTTREAEIKKNLPKMRFQFASVVLSSFCCRTYPNIGFQMETISAQQ